MWSCARYDLHLSDEDFFALTPRQFDALLKRHKHKVESNELLFGQLTSWVVNTGFRALEKPTSTEDFMPSRWKKRSAAASSTTKPKRMSRKRREAVADGLRAMFPVR